MKQIFFLFSCILAIFFSADIHGQSDTIIFNKGRFVMNKQLLTSRKVLEQMQDHPEVLNYMKQAKTNQDLATALGYIGGFCIGYPLGQAMAGGEPQWVMAGVGAGAIFLALPLISGFNKNARKAVRLYNKDVLSNKYHRVTFNIDLSPAGAGIMLRF